MAKIEHISSEEIFDSRGIPTIKTTVYLEDKAKGTTSIPSGISTGTNEAVELRDGDKNRYGGMGVLKAVNNAQGILFQAIKEIDSQQQEKIDRAMRFLDGTSNKSKIGANAILSVSQAVAAASAASNKIPLYKYIRELLGVDLGNDFKIPKPMVNLIEGGKHATNGLTFQEFLATPKKVKYFGEGYAKTLKLIEAVGKTIKKKKLDASLGVEGGFGPNLIDNEEAIDLIRGAMISIEFSDEDFDIGLDVAATSFFEDGFFLVSKLKPRLSRELFTEYLQKMVGEFNITSIEDPLNENDWDGWSQITKILSPKTLVIGDDITTTNNDRLTVAIERGAITGVVVKPNQIGTLTETLSFALRAKESGIKTVVSHRGGGTEDSFISDLAIALNADYIKIGSPLQKERFAKYDRLIQIEKEIWKKQ
jgi:enolase